MNDQTAGNTAPMHQRTPEATDPGKPLCRACRGPFEPTTAWQKFCSEPCRRGWHKVNKGKRIRLVDLEQRVAELEKEVQTIDAHLKDWWSAASPYSTPQALREGLAELERRVTALDDPTRA